MPGVSAHRHRYRQCGIYHNIKKKLNPPTCFLHLNKQDVRHDKCLLPGSLAAFTKLQLIRYQKSRPYIHGHIEYFINTVSLFSSLKHDFLFVAIISLSKHQSVSEWVSEWVSEFVCVFICSLTPPKRWTPLGRRRFKAKKHRDLSNR